MTHVVVVGAGSIGRRHLRSARAIDADATLTVVRRAAEPDDELRQIGVSTVTSLDDIDDPVDVIVLATPSANHIDLLPELVESGRALLVEKPVVTDRDDVERVRSLLVSSSPAIRAAGFNLRYLPSLIRLRDMVRSGELGTIVRATLTAGQWLPDWRPGSDYRQSYSASAERGGGVEFDLSHEFDIARWVFGDMSVAHACGGQLSSLEIDSNDTSTAILVGEGGAPIVTVVLDYVSRERVRRYEVVGDRGSLVWDIEGSLTHSDADGSRVVCLAASAFDVGQTYVTMMRRVLEASRSGDDSSIQLLVDGLASSRLAVDARDGGAHR